MIKVRLGLDHQGEDIHWKCQHFELARSLPHNISCSIIIIVIITFAPQEMDLRETSEENDTVSPAMTPFVAPPVVDQRPNVVRKPIDKVVSVFSNQDKSTASTNSDSATKAPNVLFGGAGRGGDVASKNPPPPFLSSSSSARLEARSKGTK